MNLEIEKLVETEAKPFVPSRISYGEAVLEIPETEMVWVRFQPQSGETSYENQLPREDILLSLQKSEIFRSGVEGLQQNLGIYILRVHPSYGLGQLFISTV